MQLILQEVVQVSPFSQLQERVLVLLALRALRSLKVFTVHTSSYSDLILVLPRKASYCFIVIHIFMDIDLIWTRDHTGTFLF